MKRYSLPALGSLLLLIFASCENRYRKNVAGSSESSAKKQLASLPKQQVDISKDAYQVSADEYDEFFASRYGLLYQKFSDTPFTGQIVTVENGPEGKFVIADENWRNGKKDGSSTRWFSNGVKMYERNYTNGKWNGTVTRWWPNGQKMYVRAYSKGVKHGEEATWRSDGTPINKASNVSKPIDAGTEESIELDVTEPTINTELAPEFIQEVAQPDSPELSLQDEPVIEQASDSLPEPNLPEPTLAPLEIASPEASELPSPPSDISVADEPSANEPLPELPGLPGLDGIVEASSDSESDIPMPPVVEEDTNPSDLPTLPGLPESPSSDQPPEEFSLPGLPDASEELPPMPASDDSLPGLPPLPSDGSSDGLPPLPPLP